MKNHVGKKIRLITASVILSVTLVAGYAFAAPAEDSTKETATTTANTKRANSTDQSAKAEAKAEKSSDSNKTDSEVKTDKSSKDTKASSADTSNKTDTSKNSSSTSKSSKGSSSKADFTWTEDVDCATCHDTQTDSLEDTECLVSEHATLECTSCHADSDALESQHSKKVKKIGPVEAKRLKKTTINTELCTTCHGTLEDLAEKTADCELLTDKEGTTVNPHDLPDNAEHGKIDCSSCHDMHDDNSPVEEKAVSLCESCHHQKIYECFTCHA